MNSTGESSSEQETEQKRKVENPDKDKIDQLIQIIEGCREETFKPMLMKLQKNQGPAYSDYYDFTNEDWEKLSEKLTGMTTSGTAIYNKLHPGNIN